MLFSASGVVHGDSLKKLETIDFIYPVPGGGGGARGHPLQLITLLLSHITDSLLVDTSLTVKMINVSVELAYCIS